jgi:hypothetical protein
MKIFRSNYFPCPAKGPEGKFTWSVRVSGSFPRYFSLFLSYRCLRLYPSTGSVQVTESKQLCSDTEPVDRLQTCKDSLEKKHLYKS